MRIPRLVLLMLIASGALFLAVDRSFDAGTWPLPGPQLSVRVPFKLQHSGDYFIEVSMPNASTDKLHVVDETLLCDLSYKIETDGISEPTQHVNAIKSTGEYRWANVVLYDASPPFHLRRCKRTWRNCCCFRVRSRAYRAVSVADLAKLSRAARRIWRSDGALSARSPHGSSQSVGRIASRR
jgi:hypothetical protein